MIPYRSIFPIRGSVENRHTVLAALLALAGVVAFAIAFVTLIPPPNAVHASSSEPWVYIECEEDPVQEGDDFRLVVRKKYKDHTAPYKKIRVFWYTDPVTADATDYEHMDAVRQASNGHQSKTGKMGRTFHTRDDIYPEIDETYWVRFNNSNDEGNDGRCLITLSDNDGVGIHDLEIRSVPRELSLDEDGDETVTAYTHGDQILVTARFNHPVTTRNPETGEQTDYAGLYLRIGENRRLAQIVSGDGTDDLVFAYTVQLEDADADGVSVEEGTDDTGFYFNKDAGDIGIWPVDSGDGSMNRSFHGLDDDPAHPVAQPEVIATIVPPSDPPPLEEEPSIVLPEPGPWVERSVNLDPSLLGKADGELTAEDEGRDWYSFEAVAGEDYFIELVSTMDLRGNTPAEQFSSLYVDNHLIDPSILEIVNEGGEQVMGEVNRGGFLSKWARAHFVAPEGGIYYVAVGSGPQIRGFLGFYTLSIRADDYADDYYTVREVILRPGESITGGIDSDVPPDHPGLNPWDWWETSEGHAQPLRGLESLDDRDFIRFEIDQAGDYQLQMNGAPPSVGIWATWSEDGYHGFHAEPDPVLSVEEHYEPGTYFVEVGTPWQSAGNTGLYDVYLHRVQDEATDSTDS